MSREIITRLPPALQAEGEEFYLPDESDRQIVLLQQEVATLNARLAELDQIRKS